mmetsp:Transcript_42632/g.127420  ORF Transcript_42632/g.127420 Transcript_42632/m.127420 type:complete len:509 (-) Transcript_42632:241-1767(-)
MPQAPLDKLYWINAGEKKIQRANLDGSGVEDIVSGLEIVHGLAIDPEGERIYWIDMGQKKIQRAAHDGSDVEDVVCGLEGPSALALGPLKIYWADRKLKQILCANLNGSRVTAIVSDLQFPNALALDSSAGKLYWGDYGSRKIHRANLDGSCVEVVVPYGKNSNGIVVDALHGKVFWANFGTKAIYRSNLNGSDMEPIVTGLENPNAIALGPKTQRVYWVDRDVQKIQRAFLDGSGVEDVVSEIQDPWGVVLGPESGDASGPAARMPEARQPAPAELRLRVMRQESGAAPVTMLFDPQSTGKALKQRVQDVAKKAPAGREQRFFFTNPGGERTEVKEPWKTLEAMGIQDGATLEADVAPLDQGPPMAGRQEPSVLEGPGQRLGGPAAAAAGGEGAAPEASDVREIRKYSWGDEGGTIKIYIMEASNAEAVAAAKDGKGNQVRADFKASSFTLTVHGDSQCFMLALRGLFREVVPEKCKFRVSEGKKITVTLAKKFEHEAWKVLSEKTW